MCDFYYTPEIGRFIETEEFGLISSHHNSSVVVSPYTLSSSEDGMVVVSQGGSIIFSTQISRATDLIEYLFYGPDHRYLLLKQEEENITETTFYLDLIDLAGEQISNRLVHQSFPGDQALEASFSQGNALAVFIWVGDGTARFANIYRSDNGQLILSANGQIYDYKLLARIDGSNSSGHNESRFVIYDGGVPHVGERELGSCPVPRGKLFIDPTIYAFDPICSDQTATKEFTFTNRGNDCLFVKEISSTNNFSAIAFSPFALNLLENRNVEIAFNPNGIVDPQIAETLDATWESGDGDAIISLSLTAESLALRPNLFCPSNSINFGSICVNDVSNQAISIWNNGCTNAPNITITSTNAAFKVVNTPNPITINKNGRSTVGIEFSPPNRGNFAGNLNFSDPTGQRLLSIQLIGTGLFNPLVVSNVTRLRFRTICVHESLILNFVLNNEGICGNAQISIQQPPSAPFQVDALPTIIQPGDSIPISVLFSPNNSGFFTDTLVISVGGTGQNLQIEIEGKASDFPNVTVRPKDGRLFVLDYDEDELTLNFLVGNIGCSDADIIVEELESVTGGTIIDELKSRDREAFKIVQQLPATIIKGDVKKLKVRFSPNHFGIFHAEMAIVWKFSNSKKVITIPLYGVKWPKNKDCDYITQGRNWLLQRMIGLNQQSKLYRDTIICFRRKEIEWVC